MADKITIRVPFSQSVRALGRIGRVGENVSRRILFDCTSALAGRTSATIACVIQRPSYDDPYLAPIEETDEQGVYSLTLRDVDVAIAGIVKIELRLLDGEEILKAAIYTGVVEPSITADPVDPGNPVADMLDKLESAADTANEAVKQIDAAVTKAENAVTEATTAVTNANEAITAANTATETAKTAASNATTAADTANTAATKADASASNADASAAQADTAAASAKESAGKADASAAKADTATANANDAADKATAAATTATASAGKADTAATNAQNVADTVQKKLDAGELKGEKGDKGDAGDLITDTVTGSTFRFALENGYLYFEEVSAT